MKSVTYGKIEQCIVSGIKTEEKNGYNAVQIASIENNFKLPPINFLEKNPDRVSEVKDIDRAFEDKIREMEIDLEAFKTEAQDAQDAREHFSKDRTSKAFALISLVGFLIYCFFVTLMGDDVSDATTNLVIGYLGGLVSSAASSFYGSSSNVRK